MKAARPRTTRRRRPVVPPPPDFGPTTFSQIPDSSPAGGGTAANAAKMDIGATNALRRSSQMSQARACLSTARRSFGVTGGTDTFATMVVSSSQSLEPIRIRRYVEIAAPVRSLIRFTFV